MVAKVAKASNIVSSSPIIPFCNRFLAEVCAIMGREKDT